MAENENDLMEISNAEFASKLDKFKNKIQNYYDYLNNGDAKSYNSTDPDVSISYIKLIDFIQENLNNREKISIKKVDNNSLTELVQREERPDFSFIHTLINSIISTINPLLDINYIDNKIYYSMLIETLAEDENKIDQIKKNITQLHVDISEEINKAKLLNTEHALKGFKKLYVEESKKQNFTSILWLILTFLLYLGLMASIGACFYFNVYQLEESNKSLFIFANEVTFNLVLVGIIFWCARMYSISKALCINYKHKSVSADALMSYMASIKNDDITKNTILLESSRMIFSLPETGLINKENKLDIKLLETIRDINPTKKE